MPQQSDLTVAGDPPVIEFSTYESVVFLAGNPKLAPLRGSWPWNVLQSVLLRWAKVVAGTRVTSPAYVCVFLLALRAKILTPCVPTYTTYLASYEYELRSVEARERVGLDIPPAGLRRADSRQSFLRASPCPMDL